MAKMLLGKGISINAKDRYGLTALHLAATRGNNGVVELLISKNADSNMRSTNGKTAYNFAIESKHTKIADLLKVNGANISPQKFPVLKGVYLGQKEPGMTPQLFAPGIISSNLNEHSMLVFTPDGNEVNSEEYDMQPYIAPDESYIIISRLCIEGKDLYISFKKNDGSWTKAKNMGERINSEADEFNPYVSPDGKYFFFSRGGGCDYYWVSARVIDELKNK